MNPFIVDIDIGDDAEQSQQSEEEEGDEAESHTTDSVSDSDIDMLEPEEQPHTHPFIEISSVATATAIPPAIPPPQDTSFRRRPVPRSSNVVPSSAMETNNTGNTGSILLRSDIQYSLVLTS